MLSGVLGAFAIAARLALHVSGLTFRTQCRTSIHSWRNDPSLEQSYPNKCVLITGAASGLSRALALEFAQRGWKIAVTDLDAAKISETANAVKAAG